MHFASPEKHDILNSTSEITLSNPIQDFQPFASLGQPRVLSEEIPKCPTVDLKCVFTVWKCPMSTVACR